MHQACQADALGFAGVLQNDDRKICVWGRWARIGCAPLNDRLYSWSKKLLVYDNIGCDSRWDRARSRLNPRFPHLWSTASTSH